MTESSEIDDRIASAPTKLPIDRIEKAEPIDPMEAKDPTLAIDSADPVLPMESTEPREAMLRIERVIVPVCPGTESSTRPDHAERATSGPLLAFRYERDA